MRRGRPSAPLPSYSLEEVNVSAARWRMPGRTDDELRRRHAAARARCASRRAASTVLDGGGWCYRGDTFPASVAARQRDWQRRPIEIDERGYRIVALANNQSYLLPAHHFPPDARLLEALEHLLVETSSAAVPAARPASVLDLGAGVGQYGRALLARNPHARYRGVDGAGDVEEMSGGFVKFADLTQLELALPRSCWVMSFAVGEHVPAKFEPAYVRNLHAHACRGVLVHWGPPEVGTAEALTLHRSQRTERSARAPRADRAALCVLQVPGGKGHVNMRSAAYVRSLFEGLGYRYSAHWTDSFRFGLGYGRGGERRGGGKLVSWGPAGSARRTLEWHAPMGPRFDWFTKGVMSTMVFERNTPLVAESEGCHAEC